MGNSYTWDAEERVATANGVSYFYTAAGDRAGKSGSTPTDYIYFNGRQLARLTNGAWTDLIYGTGGILAEVPGSQTGAATYRLSNHIGSSIGMVSSAGSPLGVQDYAPFGQLFNGSSTTDPYKFTGKERDAESGETHAYTYDAEGNLTQIDGGSSATFTYDAENERVRRDIPGHPSNEYIFNAFGQRASVWDATDGWASKEQAYWGSMPVELHNSGAAHYQQQDWLGTERMVTGYTGSVEGTYTSLPFGDGFQVTGSDPDQYHFAGLDYEYKVGTNGGALAQYRMYDNTNGSWMSPDPYGGSYDFTNPQSFDRYAYVNGMPTAYTDPSGQDDPLLFLNVICGGAPGACAGASINPIFAGVLGGIALAAEIGHLFGWWGHPTFHGSLKPRPNSPAPNNSRNCSTSPASAGQYAAATAQVGAMTAQFFSGLGPGDPTFGPGTATSAVMGQSAGVQDVLNQYYMLGRTNGLYSFGAVGAASAGGNPVAQFVGSFRWSISGGNLSLTNTTSFRSLTYDMGSQWQRSSFSPMGNTHQTYNISVTCH